MQITDVVLGLAGGMGLDLSPDGTSAWYVESSAGELSRVEMASGRVTTVATGLACPQDVEIDWRSGEMFVSERTGAIVRIRPDGTPDIIVKVKGAPQQLHLQRKGKRRFLYTVCCDSGRLFRIDIDRRRARTMAKRLRRPVGLVIDAAGKFAYVTEQDQGTLSRIKLTSGASKKLFSGLYAPAFLAWDSDASGIYCVQRDLANTLVRLDLGPPRTVEEIAVGLPFRSSGVAPDADRERIYICAEQKLQAISFNGCPPVVLPAPPFDVESIQFNFATSLAIPLKDHIRNCPVPVPEYVKGVCNEPAAYPTGVLPRIRVVLRLCPGFVPGTKYAIGAAGSLGGVRRQTVSPVFDGSGLSDPIEFEFMRPLPETIGKHQVVLDWHAREVPGASVPVSIGMASHPLYLVLGTPTNPWIAETPWVAALELACDWAGGAATPERAASQITERFYNCGRVHYNEEGGTPGYGYDKFNLSQMIERLNGRPALEEKVNCTDCANTVSTFANIVGCDLWQCRMGTAFGAPSTKFDLNPILAIGFPPPDPRPLWSYFFYHEVAWEITGADSGKVFDACLMIDSDRDPTTAPQAWRLPAAVPFGDCSRLSFRSRLSTPGANGCANCQPHPECLQRRPIC